MGTRSITTIIDNQWPEGKPEKLCTMYRQYDGYPSGHGKELFDFLSQFTIVNGKPLVSRDFSKLERHVLAYTEGPEAFVERMARAYPHLNGEVK